MESNNDFPVMVAGFWRQPGNVSWNPNEGKAKQFHDDDKRLIDFAIDPGTQTDHSMKGFPQTTDMETRGDDAFSLAVNTLTAVQDPDLSSYTPNQGRKTLIFSDGRQKAAKLAKNLSRNSMLDESRKVLFSMLRRPWFRKMEEAAQGHDITSIHGSVCGHHLHARHFLRTEKDEMTEQILLTTKPNGV